MRTSRDIRKYYHSLLHDPRWIAFSNRIISEWGCCWLGGDDCGNQLQVHHLVYRDVYPWDYEDYEVRVLCRRHHELVHEITDDIWVACLRFEPANLPRLKKILRSLFDSDEPLKERITIIKGSDDDF